MTTVNDCCFNQFEDQQSAYWACPNCGTEWVRNEDGNWEAE